MKYPSAVALLLLGVVPVLLAGCSSGPSMREVDPKIPVLEKVETLSKELPPNWVLTPSKYKDAKSDMHYFGGVGFPRQTLVFAMHSADEDAFANIAKYIGQAVAVKWQSAGEARNLHGQQSIETVVEEFVKKSVAIARVRHAEPVETYVERVSAHHAGTQVIMHRVYRLYEMTKSDLAATAKTSGAQVAEEIQKERDEIRKEQLKKLEDVLKGLNADDFKI
ncbi:MAG: hypothetical protein ABIF82_04440 [Planctomycetota bacterium]